MRAATVIVGAIAIASCLVAIALVLSNSGEPDRAAVTAPAPRGQAEGVAGGLTQCGAELTIEGGTCELAESVVASYRAAGGEPFAVEAQDPESGALIVLDCAGTAPSICESAEGVVVYFAP